jgi:alpha-methylacyl-CoA racemase
MTMFYGLLASANAGSGGERAWKEAREENFLDGGSHYYNVYETADGRHICIGSIEPQFYQLLLDTVGLTADDLGPQNDRGKWPANRDKLAAVFKRKTQAEWTEIMSDTDICFAPVLAMSDAPHHPHNAARGSFIEVAGVTQPGPAPKFSRTAPATPAPPAHAGENTVEALSAWGFDEKRIAQLVDSGAVRQRQA